MHRSAKQYCLKMFSEGLEIDLYIRCGDELSCRKVGLGEETWKDHETNRSNWTAWSTVIQQVHESDQLSLPSTRNSFVASGRCVEPDAPAFDEFTSMEKRKKGTISVVVER